MVPTFLFALSLDRFFFQSGPGEQTLVSSIFAMNFDHIEIFNKDEVLNPDDDELKKKFEMLKSEFDGNQTKLTEFEAANFVRVLPSTRFENIERFHNIGVEDFLDFSVESGHGKEGAEPATEKSPHTETKQRREVAGDVADEAIDVGTDTEALNCGPTMPKLRQAPSQPPAQV